jgi:hypothetical protein
LFVAFKANIKDKRVLPIVYPGPFSMLLKQKIMRFTFTRGYRERDIKVYRYYQQQQQKY